SYDAAYANGAIDCLRSHDAAITHTNYRIDFGAIATLESSMNSFYDKDDTTDPPKGLVFLKHTCSHLGSLRDNARGIWTVWHLPRLMEAQ
ncbi:hypothetical protein HAX54_050597, partial [Datura stramonium]|nr:hypothetical protein [Datura stramonium]